MGDHFAADPTRKAGRQQADGRDAPYRRRTDVRSWHRLPVGVDAKGFAAPQHGKWLFLPLDHDGTLDRIHHALYVRCREMVGCNSSPTAAIIDSQSV